MADNRVAELLLKIKTVGAEAVDKLAESFDAMKEVAVGVFGVISAVVLKSVADYREQEEATNSLTRAMINNGIYSKELKNDYLDQASALQKVSIFGDEQIISAQGILQSYIGQTKVSKELIQATLDLATAKKMDLASAAEAVGKAIGTNTNALARNGIEVTSNASQTQKLGEVLRQVEGRWGGQAKAATEGTGSITLVKNVISDLFETIGEKLVPAITYWSRKLIALGTDTATTTPIIDAFIYSVKLLAEGGAIVGGIFQALSKVIGVTLGNTLETVSQVLSGNFRQAWESAKTGIKEFANIVPDVYAQTAKNILEVDKSFHQAKSENYKKEEQMLMDSNARKAEVATTFAAEESSKALALQIEQQQIDMQLLEAGEENRARVQLQARIKAQENILKNTTDANKKLAAQQEIYNLNEQQKQAIIDQKNVENRKATFATIATLAGSSNHTLAMIGKAAGITQIAIDTPVAISKALAAFPPPYNFVAAGLVGTAMAAQASQIAGVQLAEGGIVKARPGGIQATIGEGGQDEAVIPLDRAGDFGLGGGGGGVNVTFTGPIMGDETQAREFAIKLDQEFLKLRRNNESVSFDSGVT